MRFPVRPMTKYLNKGKSSKEIRKQFIDYFVNEHGHNFVRSSPVVPFCDPTVAFVNAGMNQFKSVLMGKQEPQYKKAANYQKCVRVGGKHNDLNIIGSDGYHHTFFEMLGNWSFGDYFKKEACVLAWNLLTNVYKIPPSHLYVTYFKGDEQLGIEEDIETKEIWKSLGVPENRILSFNIKENFWEMGPTGPCGPSSEIHVDHIGSNNRAVFVNKGLHDLTELWNIVFIEYNRNLDGTLSPLASKHIDTGLGFERLTSVLQGKISNYDTDNFSYLIRAIQKICSGVPKYRGAFGERDWNSLDMGYRVLSDHTRMITACLADGMIPEQNQKLRRIMRKAFLLSETTFKHNKGLLQDLAKYVVEHLGPFYPEMEKYVDQILQIIGYEEEVFTDIRRSAAPDWSKITEENPKLSSLDVIETPNVIAAYKDIRKTNPSSIDGKVAFKLYDTFGIDKETMMRLADALNLKFDENGFENEMNFAKNRSKSQSRTHKDNVIDVLLKDNVIKTEDSFKYDYSRNPDGKYEFKELRVKVLKIISEEKIISEIGSDTYCSLLLDKTNLYTEAGGQMSDKGTINFGDKLFQIMDVENKDGFILHKGFLQSDKTSKLLNEQSGTLTVHAAHRLQNMQNHTSTHLLNRALKSTKGATCQKSSKVTDLYLNLDVGIFGAKLNLDEIVRIEKGIKELITAKVPVNVKNINSLELFSLDNITLIPGEVYPETDIRLIEIANSDFISREPCCGTHVFNTCDIEDFCIIGFKSLGRSTMSIHGVTGDRARLARKNGIEILDSITSLKRSVDDNIDKPEILDKAVTLLKSRLKFSVDSNSILPVTVKQQCLERLNSISKQIKDTTKRGLKEFIDIEMKNVLESNVSVTKNNNRYILHYLRSSMLLDTVPLQKATKLCQHLPILIIAFSDNMVKARCCVPKDYAKQNFNAEKWLKETVAATFKSAAAPPKGQDGNLVCNMKPKRVSTQDWDVLLNNSLEAAKKFVEENL